MHERGSKRNSSNDNNTKHALPDARKSCEGPGAISDTVHVHQHRPVSPLYLPLLYTPLHMAQQGSHELVHVQVSKAAQVGQSKIARREDKLRSRTQPGKTKIKSLRMGGGRRCMLVVRRRGGRQSRLRAGTDTGSAPPTTQKISTCPIPSITASTFCGAPRK